MKHPPLWGLALAVPLLASPWLGAADAQWRSWFFQWRGPHSMPLSQRAAPVLLAIDSDSLALDQLLPPAEREASPLWRRMGAWPWPRALQAELAAAGGFSAFAAYIDCEKCYDHISLTDLSLQGCQQGLARLVALAAAQYGGQRYIRWAGAVSNLIDPPMASRRAAPWRMACSTSPS